MKYFKLLFILFAALSFGMAWCVAIAMPIWMMFSPIKIEAAYLVYLFISDMYIACGMYCFPYFLDVMSSEKLYMKTRRPKPSESEKFVFTLLVILYLSSIMNVILCG